MLANGRTTSPQLSGFALLARAMGMAAGNRGETALDNPFVDEPEASAAWIDGWMQCRADLRGTAAPSRTTAGIVLV